jgi:transcriptional regulator with XRE-family HTH domain
MTAEPDGPIRGTPGELLRARRKQQGMRQHDVAVKAGCVTSYVCMFEKGLEPTVPMKAALAAAVNASVGSFW